MKKILTFLLLLTTFSTGTHAFSKTSEKIVSDHTVIFGDWSGILDVKVMQLTLILHIEQGENILKAKIDCLEQGVQGIEVVPIRFVDKTLNFEIKTLQVSYEGTFNEETCEFSGNFIQNGVSFPLNFKKGTPVTTVKRPQEPKLPYPYSEEEVTFENNSAGLTLSGTFTFPKAEGPFPTVLLIAGSGPVDRNEAIMGHKPFLVLADHLTRHGIAVLRLDKRGIGKSTGNYEIATSEDFASDSLAGIEYLKTRKETGQIGLVGHSEGGMIAPMVSLKTKNVDFMILMAGPGAKCEDLWIEQCEQLLRVEGASEDLIEKESILRKEMCSILKHEPDVEKAEHLLKTEYSKYLENLPESLKEEALARTGGKKNIDALIKRFNTNWFRYFLSYDPFETLKKVKISTLALNGSLDLQVLAKQNLPLIKQALEMAENPDYTILELPQHNHLFQVCETGSVSEYSKIEETISPMVLDTILEWVLDRSAK